MIELSHIRDCLAGHSPQMSPTEGMNLAGVTLLLRTGIAGPELLLIERAKREGDPWSGHMAFPGGRREAGDFSLRETAERETREEVGLSLADAHFMGGLGDMGGRAAASSKMLVSAYVYRLDDPGRLEIDRSEVADAFWVSLDHLIHPDNHVPYPIQYGEHEVIFPGIRVDGDEPRIVWGLTYRFLEMFFEIIGNPLTDHGIPDPESFVKLSQ